MPSWLSSLLIVLVAAVWVASFVVGLVNPKYQPPGEINYIFSTIVGGLFFGASRRKKGGRE